MSLSWFLVAVRPRGAGHGGLWDDAPVLAHTADRVELLVAGDAIMELLCAASLDIESLRLAHVELLIDGHSHRRRGSPPLPFNCTLVESDHVAKRLLDPQWKVVWR